MMSYRQIRFTCPCTRDVYAVDFVAVTHDFQLYVEWDCQCGKRNNAVMPLELITQNAPPPPCNTVSAFDIEFAKKAGIKLEA